MCLVCVIMHAADVNSLYFVPCNYVVVVSCSFGMYIHLCMPCSSVCLLSIM